MSKKIEMLDGDFKYDVFIRKLAYDKMRAYVELCPTEIGWLGYVTKVARGFLIDDVYLLKQEVTAGTTELSPVATIEYYNGLTSEQQDYYFEHQKIWCHSHVNMSTGPSGQDDSQAKELYRDVEDYYIRLITNKKNEYNITIYDKANNLLVTLDEVIVYDEENVKLRAEIAKEIDELVSAKTYAVATTTKSSSRVWDNYKHKYDDNDYAYEKAEFYSGVNKKAGTTKSTYFKNKSNRVISKFELSEIFKKLDYKLEGLF